MRSSPGECHSTCQWIDFISKDVVYESIFLNRGDDLGDLTEAAWPDLYIPKAGLGDLTGMVYFHCIFFWR